MLPVVHMYDIAPVLHDILRWALADLPLSPAEPPEPASVLTWLQLSQDLQLPALEARCMRFMEREIAFSCDATSPAYVLHWLAHAEQHGWEGVRASCMGFITDLQLSQHEGSKRYVLDWLALAEQRGWEAVHAKCMRFLEEKLVFDDDGDEDAPEEVMRWLAIAEQRQWPRVRTHCMEFFRALGYHSALPPASALQDHLEPYVVTGRARGVPEAALTDACMAAVRGLSELQPPPSYDLHCF